MRKRKITEAEIRAHLGEEFYERHERTQRLLADRMAFHRRKIEEERAAEKRLARE